MVGWEQWHIDGGRVRILTRGDMVGVKSSVNAGSASNCPQNNAAACKTVEIVIVVVIVIEILLVVLLLGIHVDGKS